MSRLDAFSRGEVPPPAAPGDPIERVDTPALIVELDAFEANLAAMAAFAARHGVHLTPHFKAHKTPAIAKRQKALGAAGFCVQKVSEAAPLVAAGLTPILVTNELVGDAKIELLCALAARAPMSVCADNATNIAALAAAAAARGVTLAVLVEVDAGSGRCGVAPGQPAADLATLVAAQSHLRFGGIQAYHGKAQHVREVLYRKTMIDQAVVAVRATTAALASAGLACPRVAGGGTGSFFLECASGVYTEIQPGSYALFDRDYSDNEPVTEPGVPQFQNALFVLATVMSATRPEHAVCDAGLKSMSFESGMPRVRGRPGIQYRGPSDEHGVLALLDGAKVAVGDRLHLIPGHVDPTVNLHDWIVATRSGRVEEVWPVVARGMVF
ncbi:MAG: DSD1 family PLP-dependent enzyme [Alphaproteobacteria bacterium]|nr:DSD1 family PLP-dependent enzyme [Alphaproteobacteria bacterium]